MERRAPSDSTSSTRTFKLPPHSSFFLLLEVSLLLLFTFPFPPPYVSFGDALSCDIMPMRSRILLPIIPLCFTGTKLFRAPKIPPRSANSFHFYTCRSPTFFPIGTPSLQPSSFNSLLHWEERKRGSGRSQISIRIVNTPSDESYRAEALLSLYCKRDLSNVKEHTFPGSIPLTT